VAPLPPDRQARLNNALTEFGVRSGEIFSRRDETTQINRTAAAADSCTRRDPTRATSDGHAANRKVASIITDAARDNGSVAYNF
jgi:hypothetical protein